MITLGDRLAYEAGKSMEKQAFTGLTQLPLTAIRASQAAPGHEVAGTGIGWAQGLGTDIGAILGAGVGGGLGAVATGGSGVGTGVGALLGAGLGGFSGYKLSDIALREIIGEDKYKEIFDAERERKVKDGKVVT